MLVHSKIILGLLAYETKLIEKGKERRKRKKMEEKIGMTIVICVILYMRINLSLDYF